MYFVININIADLSILNDFVSKTIDLELPLKYDIRMIV